MVAFGRHLAERGLIEAPCYVNVLLGNPGTSRLSPGSLGAFLAEMQLTNRLDAQAAGDRRYFEANNDEILETLLQAICSRAAAS